MDLVRNTTESFHEGWKNPYGWLVRVEGLVIITASLLLIYFILDSYRRRTRNSAVKLLLRGTNTLAYSLETYVVGLMNEGPNELCQVWAVLLLIMSATGSISCYCIDDGNQVLMGEFRDLIQSILVAWFNGVQDTQNFAVPLWLLWGLIQIRTLQRIISFGRATQSYRVRKNSRLIEEYMKYEHQLSSQEDVDPATMRGYKYLVMGEEKQNIIKTAGPGYGVELEIIREAKFITIDKVWQCEGRLLSNEGDRDGKLKDICLSFALFKLLRRRFDIWSPPAEASLPKTREFVHQGLLLNHKRAFRVVEVELAFLCDFYSTRYPIFFADGLPLFNIGVFLIVLASCGLAGWKLIHYRAPEGDVDRIHERINFDVILTAVLLVAVILKEVWDMITCIFSDWMKIELLCRYVEKSSWQRSVVAEKLLGFLCRGTVWKPWWGKLGQYSLLQSFNYNPWNLPNKVTLGLIQKTRRGAKKSRPIRVPEEVKEAITEILRANDCQLTNGTKSLERNGLDQELSWACTSKTWAQTILVWHVATALCEMEMEMEMSGINLKSLDKDTRSDYVVATSLSRYCACLLVFDPSFLPDSDNTAELIYEQVVEEAREFFKGCKSKSSRFETMRNIIEGSEGTTIEKGAQVGNVLIGKDRTLRWKVLAEFWAEMLVNVAPSGDPFAHKEKLRNGAEFITLVWALLSHAGTLNPNP